MGYIRTLSKTVAAIFVVSAFSASTAFAEMPDKSCSALSEKEMQEFYELTGEGVGYAADEPETAMHFLEEAMRMCNDDYYTEYSLARVYQEADLCHMAYFHFERLQKRESTIDDRDIKRALKRHAKTVMTTCPNVVDIEVQCASPDTRINITGVTRGETKCPFYGKAEPGVYPIVAKKLEHFDFKSSVSIYEGVGTNFNVPTLDSEKNIGHLSVVCPRGSNKFSLTNENGISNEYFCPWEGELAAGTYEIRLIDKDEPPVTVNVFPEQRAEHKFSSGVTTACSVRNFTQSNTTPWGWLLAVTMLLATGLWRRNRCVKLGE